MTERDQFGTGAGGGLRARMQRLDSENGFAAAQTGTDEDPLFSGGRRCGACGATSPNTALSCIVCGVSLSGPLNYQLVASVVPALEISLEPGQKVYAETGCLGWMTEPVHMETVMAGSPWAMVGRMVSGMTPLVSQFAAREEAGLVAFTSRVPGKIVPLDVTPGREYVLQRGAFLAAQESVLVAPTFSQSLGAMFFGGEGFVLQRVYGAGTVFAQIDGDVVQYELQDRQVLLVDPGHVGFYESGVQFSIRRVEGVKNILFSQGLFLAELRGPGNVWLQTLPFAKLVGNIALRLASASKADVAGAGVAGVLGALDSSGAGSSLLGGLGAIVENL